jgi:hypothetical protein
MTKYNEIIRLHEMLNKADIPHDFEESFDGYHICYNQGKQTVCSVIEHGYSYGSSSDRLEIMGLLTPAESVNDSVAGWLTADDVFNRIFSAHRPYAQTMKALGIEI